MITTVSKFKNLDSAVNARLGNILSSRDITVIENWHNANFINCSQYLQSRMPRQLRFSLLKSKYKSHPIVYRFNYYSRATQSNSKQIGISISYEQKLTQNIRFSDSEAFLSREEVLLQPVLIPYKDLTSRLCHQNQ